MEGKRRGAFRKQEAGSRKQASRGRGGPFQGSPSPGLPLPAPDFQFHLSGPPGKCRVPFGQARSMAEKKDIRLGEITTTVYLQSSSLAPWDVLS